VKPARRPHGSILLSEAGVLIAKSRCQTMLVALAIALSASDTGVAPVSGAGRCSYTLWPPSLSFSAAGGRSSVTVTTTDYCTWIVSADPGWISIVSPASGTGEGTIDVSVGANLSTAVRTGTLKVGGEVVSIRQEGRETCPLPAGSQAAMTVPD
jgi:Viral BACON domain